MKNRKLNENGNGDRIEVEGPKPMTMKKKKNINRLGGTGLSLQAFANAKSTTNHYNPALISINSLLSLFGGLIFDILIFSFLPDLCFRFICFHFNLVYWQLVFLREEKGVL